MSAYRDALTISSYESGERLVLAESIILSGAGVVLVDSCLALRPQGAQVQCEVIIAGTPDPSDCQAAVAGAKQLLAAASISSALVGRNLVWLAVDDYGTGTVEVWRAS